MDRALAISAAMAIRMVAAAATVVGLMVVPRMAVPMVAEPARTPTMVPTGGAIEEGLAANKAATRSSINRDNSSSSNNNSSAIIKRRTSLTNYKSRDTEPQAKENI
ncbi:uncharacterized protein LOC117134846 [Drosophila busckii]|uniref:uncharacterized protein LOC117134846 n=1 Tax=Drosophila busckii TaxID=30019 RepID=UPI0014328296|nr:uncharacterized protein LOC117134846 [Drosophila busckii]